MVNSESNVTLHMVSSLDGFIARKDGSVSWLDSHDNFEDGITHTDEYVADFLQAIDCYVMGSKTYKHALDLGWPYGDKKAYVMTSQQWAYCDYNVEFYPGNLSYLVNSKLKPNYKNIWVVGGASLTKSFLKLNLADQIIVSIMPVILGDGKLFFDFIGQEQKLSLQDVTTFKNGVVELSYEIIRENIE